MNIKIFDVTEQCAINGNVKGEEVYRRICAALSSDATITLDFGGVEIITAHFLNNAIGQLYRDHTPEELNLRLKIVNYPSGWARDAWNKVIENAKAYYGETEKD